MIKGERNADHIRDVSKMNLWELATMLEVELHDHITLRGD